MTVTIIRAQKADSIGSTDPNPRGNAAVAPPTAQPTTGASVAEAVVATGRVQVDQSRRVDRVTDYEKAKSITEELADEIRSDETSFDAHDDISPLAVRDTLVGGRL